MALVRSLSRLSDDQLSELVAAYPRLAELVDRSWHSASTSADPGKRRLLACVVVRALADHLDDAAIDAAPILARAVDNLDPIHIEMLGLVAHPTANIGWTRDQLGAAAPRYGDLMVPTLMTLSREGLIENRGAGTYDGVEAWKLTRFGRRLIAYLPDAGLPVPPLGEGLVVVSWSSAPLHVTLTNVGLGAVRRVLLHGLEKYTTAVDPVDLDYDDKIEVALRTAESRGVPTVEQSLVSVTWEDDRGLQERPAENIDGLWSYLPPD